MPNRIEELFEELAENWNSEEGQNYLDYQKDLARKTAWTALGLLPLPGARALLGTKLASKVPGAEKLYGQVGQDFTKFIEPLKSKLSGVFGRSGSGVGADVAGRYALPKAKPSVVTKRGPRGPINIGQPPAGPPRPAPSRTTRLSETDREMIKRLLIPPLTQTGQKTRGLDVKNLNRGMFPRSSPYYPKGEGLERLLIPPLTKTGQRVTDQTRWTPKGMSAKERTDIPLSDYALARSTGRLDELLIPPLGKGSKAVSGAKGLYPPPHLTEKAGSKILTRIPRPSTGKGRKDLGEPWYINSKTGELYKFHYGTGALDRGFYNITGRKTATYGASGRERSYVPNYVRDYLGKNTPTTPSGGGITATKAADKIHAQIAKREKWLKSAKDNYKRSDDAFQEGVRSGSQPDIKAGSKGVEKFGNRIAQLEKEIADLLKSLE